MWKVYCLDNKCEEIVTNVRKMNQWDANVSDGHITSNKIKDSDGNGKTKG